MLGQGAYAIVKVGYSRVTGERRALKIVSTRGCSFGAIQRVVTEADTMLQLRHPNVIGLTDMLVNDGSITLVSEMLHLNLYELMNKRQKKFTERELQHIFRQIALGMKHIHSHNLIHRDIKPENILVSVGLGG